jgi:hypothetical protein
MTDTLIYCCGCKKDVAARLTDGKEIYPYRDDLFSLPFWKCDTCGNHVGCHHKTADRTRPLGNIPTKAIRDAREHIHRILDPIWKQKIMPRGKLYARISKELGYQYHTAEIKSVEDARKVYAIIKEIAP